MDGCVLLTSTPSCVVSPRGETTHSGVDVNNTHPSMINPLNDTRPSGHIIRPTQVDVSQSCSHFPNKLLKVPLYCPGLGASWS